jgi:hypothetical protein
LQSEGRRIMVDLPRLDKTIITIASLDEPEKDLEFWMTKTKIERLQAIEINRRLAYGKDRVSERLQRFFEITELI